MGIKGVNIMNNGLIILIISLAITTTIFGVMCSYFYRKNKKVCNSVIYKKIDKFIERW